MTLRPRYQVGDVAQPDTGEGSFFGRFVYERIVPQDHFLVALEHLFDWQGISEQLIGAYRGRGLYGRPPYDPAQIFKMLFISYLYGVSERQVSVGLSVCRNWSTITWWPNGSSGWRWTSPRQITAPCPCSSAPYGVQESLPPRGWLAEAGSLFRSSSPASQRTRPGNGPHPDPGQCAYPSR